MTIIDNAVYVGGHRAAHPDSLEQTFETLEATGGSMAWIGLYRPTPDEMAQVAHEFRLHDLAVEDAVHAHQRPKSERYGENLFTVLRPARYDDATETVEFGEL
ncbi:CorA family divalent cation transporter, partial [Sinomonas sp.]|uniref:CorA family divalent cation transporter n=1 Tax=Sinomonas sp. TaxID=1914986 RepID=UPI002FE1ED41